MDVMIDHPSPNHDARPDATPIDMLVVHYTGMQTGEAALARLCDPAARVSAHYLIEEDGRVFRLVDETRRAWHAGVSSWRGASDINGRSIGVELVHPGLEWGYRAFASAQVAAFAELARALVARHAIPARNIVGHSDVAPARKQDPGELFPWRELASAGLGSWPAPGRAPVGSIGAAQRLLATHGYGVPESGVLDAPTRLVLEAFQRHFRPARIDGALDDETARLIAGLAD